MNIRKLKEEQLKLARKVVTRDDLADVNLIAGCDQAFIGKKIISAIVVLDAETMKVVERKHAVVESNIPYIPGYLSYREAPAIIEAFRKLEQRPDVLVVDANGILHPRGIGMASHLGILLDIPTIGVAKNLFMGEVRQNKIYVNEELRAVEFRTREHAKPVYVSPGHRVSLKTSHDIIKRCVHYPHKLPEPIHLAHRHANKIRQDMILSGS